jgi:iron complex transport system substrate-binding protein
VHFQRSLRRAVLASTAAMCVAATGACADDKPAGNAPSTTTRVVAHDAGSTEVPTAPKRIVSLSVSLTGHLLALEAPVVATQASPGPFSDPTGFFLQWADVAKQRNVEVAYAGTQPDLEKVVALKPDLIIGSATGADSTATFYKQLSEIAPTLIFRYDNLSWADLTRKLGDALGLQDKAGAVLSEFDGRVTRVKGAIKPPAQEVAPLRDGETQVVIFTDKSAQGLLLASLGFKVRAVPANLASGTGNEGARDDIVTVALENLGPALGDSSIFFVGHRAADITAAQARPLWSGLPAVRDKRAYDLGVDSFRLDLFSATAILDRLEQQFAA